MKTKWGISEFLILISKMGSLTQSWKENKNMSQELTSVIVRLYFFYSTCCCSFPVCQWVPPGLKRMLGKIPEDRRIFLIWCCVYKFRQMKIWTVWLRARSSPENSRKYGGLDEIVHSAERLLMEMWGWRVGCEEQLAPASLRAWCCQQPSVGMSWR